MTTLRNALKSDRVHHAYLFDGPDGVGKELAAFGLAQALVCEVRGLGAQAGDNACGECGACQRAIVRPGDRVPTHPDVVVLERGLYEPAQLGRRTAETQEISVDQVRKLVLEHAAFPPHEGRARVFIVRRAEELSTSAANSLLKTLEEPISRTYFVLVTSTPNLLLSTIRSRTQRVRFAQLGTSVVESLLIDRGIARERAADVASIAGGSIGAAIALAESGAAAAHDQFVQRAHAALKGASMSGALELAEAEKKSKADLGSMLEAFAVSLAAAARKEIASGDFGAAVAAARQVSFVFGAVRAIDANGSPQLALEALFTRMRGTAR